MHALRIKWVLLAKFFLRAQLALVVDLNGCTKVAKFLVLLTHAQLCHDLDCSQVIKLELETVKLCVLATNTFGTFLVDFQE